MNVSNVDANLRRCPSAGAVFETYDLDVGREYINAAYGTRARIRRSRPDELVRHSRHDFGSFSLNDITLGLDTDYEVGPLGSLVVLQPRAGWIDRSWGDSVERIGPGETAAVSPPHKRFSVHLHNFEFGSLVLDRPLLMRTAGFAQDERSSALYFTGTRPASPWLAGQWRIAVEHLRSVIEANPDVMSEPLLVGNLARGLAENALATFPNTEERQPTSAEGSDATPAAVHRAVAYMESNAETDISLADIATAARVAPRALRIAFARHHTTTAFGFLRSVRLDRAHFELLAAAGSGPAVSPGSGAGATTVASVAARWGFATPTAFAAAYHHIYGVSPDETLAA